MKAKYTASPVTGDVLPRNDSQTFEAKTYAKVSRRLIPFLMLCYLGAYLDRVNVGFAKLQMLSDLRFSETVYGMGAGIFFLGYFLFEVPSNVILHRVGARRWLARIMLTWAVISASFVFVKSPTAFYVLRFLLGVAEAGFAPGVILYLTYWFPSERRAKALSLFFMAIPLAGMVGGPLSGWIMHSLQGAMSMAGWKWLFLLEALPSLVLGFAILLYLDDGIKQAKWLTDSEKALLARNVAADAEHKTAHVSIRAFIGDRRLWLMASIYFCVVLGQYGLTFWLPTIIRKSGVADPLWVGVFTAIPYLCAIIALPLIGMSADRRRERHAVTCADIQQRMRAMGGVYARQFRAHGVVECTIAVTSNEAFERAWLVIRIGNFGACQCVEQACCHVRAALRRHRQQSARFAVLSSLECRERVRKES